MPPVSPMVQQQMGQQQNIPISSPMPPRSPAVQQLNHSQPANSPMPSQSPVSHQAPNTPINQPQYIQQINQGQPPSSPMQARSPMVHSLSPMPMRGSSVASSPSMSEGPHSMENPTTPRTPHTPFAPQTPQNTQQDQGGPSHSNHGEVASNSNNHLNPVPGPANVNQGGNQHNPPNDNDSFGNFKVGLRGGSPMFCSPMFGRFGRFKLGLRGGSPIWAGGLGRGSRQPGGSKVIDGKKNDERGSGCDSSSNEMAAKDVLDSTVGKTLSQQGPSSRVLSQVSSLVSMDYNEFDDENSHTPPLSPPLAKKREIDDSSSLIIVGEPGTFMENQSGNISGASSDKTECLEDSEVLDDDDNKDDIMEHYEEMRTLALDENLISSEVSLMDAVQCEQGTECGNVVVLGDLTESEFVHLSSSLGSSVIEECIVSSSDIVLDIPLDGCEKISNPNKICLRSHNFEPSDEKSEQLSEGKEEKQPDCKEIKSIDDSLTIVVEPLNIFDSVNLVSDGRKVDSVHHRRSSKEGRSDSIRDTPESPDPEEMNIDPSPGSSITPERIRDDDGDNGLTLIEESENVMDNSKVESPQSEIIDEKNNGNFKPDTLNYTLDKTMTPAADNCPVSKPILSEISATPISSSQVEIISNPSFLSVVSDTVSHEGALRPLRSLDIPSVNRIPPSSAHQANIGIPGASRPAVTFPTYSRVSLPDVRYSQEVKEQDVATFLGSTKVLLQPQSTTTTSALNSVIASTIVHVPATEIQKKKREPIISHSTLPSSVSTVDKSDSNATLLPQFPSTVISPESTGNSTNTSLSSFVSKEMSPNVLGAMDFSIEQPTITSLARPVQQPNSAISNLSIIRPHGVSAISTAISMINSAISSTVPAAISKPGYTSTNAATLAADAVNTARLPYPPAVPKEPHAFTTSGVVSLSSISGVSVIASAPKLICGITETISTELARPRMSVPLPNTTYSSNITQQPLKSSDIRRSPVGKHTLIEETPSAQSLLCRILEDDTPDESYPSIRDSRTIEESTAVTSHVTRPSVLESINKSTREIKHVTQPILTHATDDVEDEEDDILLRTMTQLFQDTRPSVVTAIEKIGRISPKTNFQSALEPSISNPSQVSATNTSSNIILSKPQLVRTIRSLSSETLKYSGSNIDRMGSSTHEVFSQRTVSHTKPTVFSSLSEQNEVYQSQIPLIDFETELKPSIVISKDYCKDPSVLQKAQSLKHFDSSSVLSLPSQIVPVSHHQQQPSSAPSNLMTLLDQTLSGNVQVERSVRAGPQVHSISVTRLSVPPQQIVTTSSLASHSMLESRLTGTICTGSSVESYARTAPESISYASPATNLTVIPTVVMSTRISQNVGQVAGVVPLNTSGTMRQGTTSADYSQQRIITGGKSSPVIRNLSMPSPLHSSQITVPSTARSQALPVPQTNVIMAQPSRHVLGSSSMQSPVFSSISSQQMSAQGQRSSPAINISHGNIVNSPNFSVSQTRVATSSNVSSQPSQLVSYRYGIANKSLPSESSSIASSSSSLTPYQKLQTTPSYSRFVESAPSQKVDVSSSGTEGQVDSYEFVISPPPSSVATYQSSKSSSEDRKRVTPSDVKQEDFSKSCRFEGATIKIEPGLTEMTNISPQQQKVMVGSSTPSPVISLSSAASHVGKDIVPKSEVQEIPTSCKFATSGHSSGTNLVRMEESQNVLLKQLLQNTGCAQSQSQTQSTQSVPTISTQHVSPSLPNIPSLEAQLARPVPPTPSSLLPPLLNESPSTQPLKQPPPQTSRPSPIVSRETSFVSRPVQQQQQASNIQVTSSSNQAQQQHLVGERRTITPTRTPSREDMFSPTTPTTPKSYGSGADSNLHTPSPLTSPQSVVIKKEPMSGHVNTPQQTPPIPVTEVKKEVMSEGESSSCAMDRKEFIHVKEEIGDLGVELSGDRLPQDMSASELKKLKRRQYAQKRRQSLGKEVASGGTPKKRPRKGSKVEEDYDSFIENLMLQLRQLPPMSVMEPELSRNHSVCPVFGAGDTARIGVSKDYSTRTGDLKGSYGSATLPHISDHYNTKPFGELEPIPPQPQQSTQRGFYNQEFAPLKLDNEGEDKKPEVSTTPSSTARESNNDSPNSIISSSSPECVIQKPFVRFPCLQLIDSDEEKDDGLGWLKRLSPVIPLVMPVPIRLGPKAINESSDGDKENAGVTKDNLQLKTRLGMSTPLKDSGNVTVTLTLTSAAAEDILGVLRDLANILNIPTPTGHQIVERTSTPPSQKLGLYRTKGKNGKEGAPIDIQSILNGNAKFCRHCDVVILSNLIRKKVSELPFLNKEELTDNGDDLYFCSSACYMQFALMHRLPATSEEKVAAIVDHLCQTQDVGQQKKQKRFTLGDKKKEVAGKSIKLEEDDDDYKMEVDPEDVANDDKFKIKEEIDDDLPIDDKLVKIKVCEAQTLLVKQENESLLTDKRAKKNVAEDPSTGTPQSQPFSGKQWKGIKYKPWANGCLQPTNKIKKPSDKEITELLFRMGITMMPAKIPDDTRKCMFCHQIGDGVADGPARLLNFDVDKWVHLNCALWSDDVYETVNGALMNLENALQQSLVCNCVVCHRSGATIRCFKLRCSNVYHLNCAVKDGCVFYKNKSTYCTAHIPKNEKDNELTTLSVFRRVYVNRDENRQVAAVMHHTDQNNLLRVGSLIFLSVGQLLPHQLHNFHTPNFIYPIGYKIVRFFWSMRVPNKRCRYVCSIHDVAGRPEFRVLVQEPSQDDLELRDVSPRAVWTRILEPLAALRREIGGVQMFPKFLVGEDLFGLNEPAVVRVLESLPGIETLTDYRFKYGRNPLLELPLAINPSGCARTEPKLRSQFPWKRPHTQRTGSSSRPVFVPTATVAGEASCPYSKQFVHSKSSQYKKMKQEWRNNVYLARSKIQGLGLYAARDLERHTMVIEYIGEVIRTELSEIREKQYEAKNRGIYMFRLDEERVVDATLSGGLARYINHSCNPNCVAEIVEVERDLRIIIFAKRRVSRGEELAYDYKFDIEDESHKIPCNCGAPNCRKWMN
ncbi:unnamed protein product [Timema podura]|uniref:Histone-lysine N-methyltransferase n=1 Tax=Timema podura TaxID=61482 RepID=A0ABN7NJ11_TIMPD|nr:unnamed protein product [Timema podura]